MDMFARSRFSKLCSRLRLIGGFTVLQTRSNGVLLFQWYMYTHGELFL